ncbi:DUF2771 family protein [Nakamurella antarctica]|nr:DUF2771 family protein [Nakamurella antarctica]
MLRIRRTLAAVFLAAASVGLTACTPSIPSVTWYANGKAVDVGPALYCNINATLEPDCPVFNGPVAKLALRPGDGVQVNIPSGLYDAPWTLVVTYGDESERTSITRTEKTYSYVVKPPRGKSITQIDLQVLVPIAGTDGGVEYTPAQLWVLEVTPA